MAIKTIKAKSYPIEYKSLLRTTPKLEDADNYIDSDTLITDQEGKPLLLYKILVNEDVRLKDYLFDVNYSSMDRSGGIKTRSAIFGYIPRNALRRDYCSISKMSRESPRAHKELYNCLRTLMAYYKEYFPEELKFHIEQVKARFDKRWLIRDTPFTSGIVNFNSSIKYHFDAGNIKDCLSNMLILQRGCLNADFIVPEFRLAFKSQNNAVVIFNGQKILHGVTPLTLQNKQSFRFSIVYYTLEQLWQCLAPTEELLRASKMKTKRLQDRALA